MSKKNVWVWTSVLSLFLVLAGCSSNDTNTPADKDQKPAVESNEVSSYTVTDDADNEVTFDKVPETVISLQPSNTEILYALDEGDKLIGATDYDTYPSEALGVERISDSVTFNAERIVELKPDVVLAYTIGEDEALNTLRDSDIPVFVIESASSFDDVYGDIIQIAEVMNVKDQGEKLVDSIKSRISKVQEKLTQIETQQQMYYEISPAPDIYTTGSNTFQQEIFDLAKVNNVFADQEGWIKVSEEDILKKNPDVIITTVSYEDDAIANIKKREGWDVLDAVKENRVWQLDSDIMSRPGPRIGEAVELLAKSVYPDEFN
ncbi:MULTISPECIES: ABC transporter substrate-binding protein [Sporosarcina]|uniref:ABC transporter substrate-binding protein n=1 Tax=Sporosarcina TaxID=1569 RepID=UPI000A17C984|nr:MULTISPECIES: ABC transporter substrate-binding protein [Sporosarcina]ARK22281.1 cobalamin-binding protein [Sporosarcina ureae]PIC74207.1 ABC transporter substrate-binding protein [Sporosarcina sp. P17b]